MKTMVTKNEISSNNKYTGSDTLKTNYLEPAGRVKMFPV